MRNTFLRSVMSVHEYQIRALSNIFTTPDEMEEAHREMENDMLQDTIVSAEEDESRREI